MVTFELIAVTFKVVVVTLELMMVTFELIAVTFKVVVVVTLSGKHPISTQKQSLSSVFCPFGEFC